jgi:hypothetical protein
MWAVLLKTRVLVVEVELLEVVSIMVVAEVVATATT